MSKPRSRRSCSFVELLIVFSAVFIVVVWQDGHELPVPAFIERVIAPLSAPDEPVVLLFAGDVMLGRHVGKLIAANSASYPFEAIAPSIGALAPDIFIANLEGPITTLNAPDPRISPEQPYSMRFSFDPSVAPALADAGFTHLSVANNHALDQGYAGAMDTINNLNTAGIAPVGYRDGAALGTIATTTVHGQSLAFVGLDTTTITHDTERLRNELAALPETTFITAFLHWGNEYEHEHSPEQESLAHFLIDNGVDLIIGAHPHVVQDVGTYKGRAIFYSLGNFVFDQYWNDDVQTGLLVMATLDGDEVSFEQLTVKSVRSQPSIAVASSTPFSLAID